MKNRVYMGYKLAGGREVFRSTSEPTQETHGQTYAAVIGPFRTVRAARFMRDCGANNPHLQCVNDAERIARLI